MGSNDDIQTKVIFMVVFGAMVILGGTEGLFGYLGIFNSPSIAARNFIKATKSPEFVDLKHYVSENMAIAPGYNATIGNRDASGPLLEATQFMNRDVPVKIFKGPFSFSETTVAVVFLDDTYPPLEFTLKRSLFDWRVHKVNYVTPTE